VIGELLLLPGTTAGRGHANFQLYMLHADLSVVGSVHSHPSGALHPSAADLRLFRSWGRRHVIVGAPFTTGCWRAYDGNGQEIHLDVVGPGLPPGGRRSPTEYRPLPSSGSVPDREGFPDDEA
jgi:hypothetical protein